MTDATDTVREIEKIHERAIVEHVICKIGDREPGPCAITALRDIALHWATEARLWKITTQHTNQLWVNERHCCEKKRDHSMKLIDENARLKTELQGLVDDGTIVRDDNA